MSEQAFLGVAIPAYRREALLGRLLDSIQADVPIAVSDNGGHLSASFKARHPAVSFHAGPEVPVLANWNRAAAALATTWIVMPGDDDLYYPDSFQVIERHLRQAAGADIVFFGHHIIDEHDTIRSSWTPPAMRLPPPAGFQPVARGTPARPPAIAFRAELFRRLGGFCEEFRVTAGDNDFYQRATLVGEVVFVPAVVAGYRVWDAGSTRQTIATREWLGEIDHWCARVAALARAQGVDYPPRLRDDIYADNLRAGLRAFRERGETRAAWAHFRAARYPFRSGLLSQARLAAELLVPTAATPALARLVRALARHRVAAR